MRHHGKRTAGMILSLVFAITMLVEPVFAIPVFAGEDEQQTDGISAPLTVEEVETDEESPSEEMPANLEEEEQELVEEESAPEPDAAEQIDKENVEEEPAEIETPVEDEDIIEEEPVEVEKVVEEKELAEVEAPTEEESTEIEEPVKETAPDVVAPEKTQATVPVKKSAGAVQTKAADSASVVYSGTCGPNATWKLDSEGTLTISGTGATYDYQYTDTYMQHINSPWDNYCDRIYKVVVGSGITRIGKMNFVAMENLTSASICDRTYFDSYYNFRNCRNCEIKRYSCNITLGYTSCYYNGEAKTPSVTIKDLSGRVIPDSEYELYFSNNTNAGTASVKIEYKYTGCTRTKKFTINRRSVSTAKFPTISDKYYNGEAKWPTFTPGYNGKSLVKGRDYKTAYYNNKNAGRAKIVVTGLGNYKGTKTLYFTIKPRSISSASAPAITTKVYNGELKTPAVSLTYNNKKLVKGTDYTVKYYKNRYAGKAKIVITGKGNFHGTKTMYFKIIPQKTKILSSVPYSSNSIKITWKKAPGATGYKIYRKQLTTDKYVFVKNVTGTSTVLKQGSAHQDQVYFYVLPYKKVDGVVYKASEAAYDYAYVKPSHTAFKLTQSGIRTVSVIPTYTGYYQIEAEAYNYREFFDFTNSTGSRYGAYAGYSGYTSYNLSYLGDGYYLEPGDVVVARVRQYTYKYDKNGNATIIFGPWSSWKNITLE